MGASISFVGAGRVGSSLARSLHKRGFTIDVLTRTTWAGAQEAVRAVGAGRPSCDIREAAAAEIVFITVPDGLIATVCETIAAQGLWSSRHTVVHCSGALSLQALQAAAAQGVAVLALHPMQSISSTVQGASSLMGSFFGLEGCPRGLQVGEMLVQALDGHAFYIEPGGKGAYHAAAVMASNCLVALMDLASDLLVQAGVPRPKAATALLPLAKGTLDNIARQGIPAALTGPVERGDTATIANHLSVLKEKDVRRIYALLGERLVRLAGEKQSACPEDLAAIAALLRNERNL